MNNMDNSQLLNEIQDALESKKARNIEVVDLEGKTIICDYFVVCDAPSSILVKTLSETVEEKLEEKGVFATRKEGAREGKWIVLDYNSVILHIFLTEEREHYNIEELWKNMDKPKAE